jgi:hypothetical protein
MNKNVAEDVRQMMQPDQLPPATAVDLDASTIDPVTGAPSRLTVTFHPQPQLWIDRPVSYEVTLPPTYPAVPPGKLEARGMAGCWTLRRRDRWAQGRAEVRTAGTGRGAGVGLPFGRVMCCLPSS